MSCNFYLSLFINRFIFQFSEDKCSIYVLHLERIKRFCSLVSQYISPKIALIMEAKRHLVNKSTRRREPLEMFYIALCTIDPADLWDSSWSFIWRTLVGNSRCDRSVQFSGFLVHELPLWKTNARRGDGKEHVLRKGGRDRFSVDGLLSNTRVHISISAMHDKTPDWTRR